MSPTEFNEFVLNNKKVLIKFSSVGCMPCKIVAPIIDEIIKENPDIKYLGIDANEDRELAESFDISAVPTMIYFVDGEFKNSISGAKNKMAIKEFLNIA